MHYSYDYSPDDLNRMERGLPPLHPELGVPKELHGEMVPGVISVQSVAPATTGAFKLSLTRMALYGSTYATDFCFQRFFWVRRRCLCRHVYVPLTLLLFFLKVATAAEKTKL